MSTISQVMHSDHQRCDELFATAEEAVNDGAWSQAGGAFAAFRDATLHHFSMEEEALFPAFEAATGNTMGPTQMMRYEHEQMRALMNQMEEGITAEDGDSYLGASETLLMMMQQHNLKEEQILYPMTEQALGGNQGQVIEQMQQVGAG